MSSDRAHLAGTPKWRVLTVMVDVPVPPVTGVHVRQLANLRLVRDTGCESHTLVFSTAGRPYDPTAVAALCDGATHAGARVEYAGLGIVQRVSIRLRMGVAAILRRPSSTYPFSIPYDLADLGPKACAEAARVEADFVVLPTSLLHIAPELRAQGVRVIGDALDVLSELTLGFLKQGIRRTPLRSPGLLVNYLASRRQEDFFLKECTELWAASNDDAATLALKAPQARILVCGNTFDEQRIVPTEPPLNATIGFIGTYSYTPNLDAATFLALEVLPLVHRHRPEARLMLAGGGMPTSVANVLRAVAGVHLFGTVSDSADFVGSCALMALPIRLRGGVPLKLVESMACGRPVVATPELVAGLALVPGQEVLIASDAQGFAEHVRQLLTDPELGATLARNAQSRFVEEFSYGAMLTRVRDQSVLKTSAPSTR